MKGTPISRPGERQVENQRSNATEHAPSHLIEPFPDLRTGGAPHSGHPHAPLRPAHLLQLQHTAGNCAVQRLLAITATRSPLIQRDDDVMAYPAFVNETKSLKVDPEQTRILATIYLKLDDYQAKKNTNDEHTQLQLLDAKIKAYQASGSLFSRWTTTPVDRLGAQVMDELHAWDQFIQGKAAATATHRADRDKLVAYVEEGLKVGRDKDRRLVNSCEWVKSKKTKLYALTPTGDSARRLKRNNLNPATDEAFFPSGTGGPGDIFSPEVGYNELNFKDPTNISLDKGGKSTGGWNGAGFIAVMKASTKSKEGVWGTLRHEVQHDADKNQQKRAALPAKHADAQTDAAYAGNLSSWGDNPDILLEYYKTEYRAYNYEQNKFEGISPGPVQKYGYTWDAKQLAIFEHIWRNYQHTKYLWDPSDKAFQAKSAVGKDAMHDMSGYSQPDQVLAKAKEYRDKIHAYRNPDAEGLNKWNSVRVDAFYRALDAMPDGAVPGFSQQDDDLLDAIQALKKEDASYILNESPDFAQMLQRKLNTSYLKGVRQSLTGRAA